MSRSGSWQKSSYWVAVYLACAGLLVGCNDRDPEIAGGEDTGGADVVDVLPGDGAISDADSREQPDAATDATDAPDAADGADADDGSVDVDITGELDSEFDDDLGLRELTPDDKSEICRAGQTFLQNNVTERQSCRWAAHFNAFNTAPMTDQKAVQACRDAFEQWEGSSGETDVCADIRGGHSCGATVGQWEACEEALTVRFVRYVQKLPACSNVSSAYYAEDYRRFSPRFTDGVDDPEACQVFRENCPEFYESWLGPIRWPNTGD